MGIRVVEQCGEEGHLDLESHGYAEDKSQRLRTPKRQREDSCGRDRDLLPNELHGRSVECAVAPSHPGAYMSFIPTNEADQGCVVLHDRQRDFPFIALWAKAVPVLGEVPNLGLVSTC